MAEIPSLAGIFKDLDITSVMRKAFGRCPVCGKKGVTGKWLMWCGDNRCGEMWVKGS